MRNKNYKKSKKFYKRKIKIRLADPNVPDSYVCEIFDSSLENEDEPVLKDCLKSEETKNEGIKPKNYFEILMSKESRQSFNINSARENEEIPEESKLSRVEEDEETIKKRKLSKEKNNEILTKLVNEKKKREFNDSSDDETLLQVQKKCVFVNSIENSESTDTQDDLKIIKEDIPVVLGPSKIKFTPKKKTLNILNYFTKVQTIKKCKANKARCKKLEEIHVSSNLLSSKKLENSNIKNSEKNLDQKKSFNAVNKENFKLAPVFKKKEKQIVDVSLQKARLEFLFKGPPIVKKQECNKTEYVPSFPICFHVQQRNNDICWTLQKISVPFLKQLNLEENICEFTKKFNFSLGKSYPTIDISNEKQNKPSQNLKCKYSNLESIINGLKEKKEKFNNSVKELEKKQRCTNDEVSFEILNTLWTEKYKPQSKDILGNENVVFKLRKWLQSWKTFDENLKSLLKSKGQKLKNEESSDNDDDIFQSDDEQYKLNSPGNVCILSGPNGCGKTSLISALAGELEFHILEVNASSKRTGKKVLTDLQEATQSHKVHRINFTQNETPVTEMKKKKGKRRRKNKKVDSSGKLKEQANNCRISLILIEDADIVFEEHDEGFFSAIASLVQTSKRPLIFLTNDPDCSHLEAFKTENALILEMEHPSFDKSYAVLEVVSTLEGGCFGEKAIESLLRLNHFDLRRSLLELQFWSQSDFEIQTFPKLKDLGRFWWGLTNFLYRQDMKHFERSKGRKRKRMNSLIDSSDEEEILVKKSKLISDESVPLASINLTVSQKTERDIHSYFSILDSVSCIDRVASRLSNSQEPTPGFEYIAKDSLSLEENMEEVSWYTTNFLEIISEEVVSLSTQIFSKLNKKEGEEKSIWASPSWEEIQWRKSQEKASKELAVLVPPQNGRDKRSMHLDYFPLVRNICRVEKNRYASNAKRKNRFYHYLNNLGINLTDENTHTNCDVFC